MGLAERLLDSFRRVCARKEKPQITRTLRPCGDGIMQARGDRQFSDTRNRTSGLYSGDCFQNTALWNWNHHDAGSILFARRIPSGEFQCVTNKQLLESDWFNFPVKRKSQGSGAETTDRPGSNLERPHSMLVDSKLRVDWSIRQTQRPHCIGRAFLDGVLGRFGEA